MSHLALIPILRTLPGWPEVADPGLWDILSLILLIPVAVFAVITVAVLGPTWFGRGKTSAE